MALEDLTESQLANLTSAVAGRIRGNVLGREASGTAVDLEIAAAAVLFLVDVAPKARKPLAGRPQSG